MALTPQAKAFLDVINAGPPLHTLPVADLRALALPTMAAATSTVVDTLHIPSPDGHTIRVKRYRPAGDTGALPALLYFFGGCWVIGAIEKYAATCSRLAEAAHCVVLCVDYRQAPEHPFPAATDDAYDVTHWAHEHAAELGIDADRIAVGGDSAGGNLAAVTAVRARDAGLALAAQLLVYPAVRHCTPASGTWIENGEGLLLTWTMMDHYSRLYVPNEADRRHPHYAVALTEDLSKLPAAVVITAEYDPLRGEGEDYAAQLRRAGVRTELWHYDGMIHGFWGLSVMDEGEAVVLRAGAWLRHQLHG
jgi:acetyl esterase